MQPSAAAVPPAPTAGQAGNAPASQAQGVALAPAGPPAQQSTPAAAGIGLRLVLSPRAACWVSVSVDGKRMPGRTLQAGEKVEVSAVQSIVLTAGDAGALDYTINNAPGRALGAAGQVLTVVINTTNYQNFLAARPPQ